MKKEENQNCVFNVHAIALYPKNENGVQSFALEVSEKAKKEISKVVEEETGYIPAINVSEESDDKYLINVKTSYDFPVFKDTGEQLENVKIYHGADVVAQIVYKPYNYKGKKGATAYLKAMVLNNNGQPTGLNFNSVVKDVL